MYSRMLCIVQNTNAVFHIGSVFKKCYWLSSLWLSKRFWVLESAGDGFQPPKADIAFAPPGLWWQTWTSVSMRRSIQLCRFVPPSALMPCTLLWLYVLMGFQKLGSCKRKSCGIPMEVKKFFMFRDTKRDSCFSEMLSLELENLLHQTYSWLQPYKLSRTESSE